MSTPKHRTRLGGYALIVAGVLFLLYPVFRPWHDELTQAGAVASMSAGAWLASHLFAAVGFILVPLGFLALRRVVETTRAEPLAFAAGITAWFGAGLTLPYYGAETFALNALARRVIAGHPLDLVDLTAAVRFGPVALTSFGAGLLLLAPGAILAAVAVWRSGTLPRLAGTPLALGFLLFMPQFLAPPPVRIAHGVLMAVGAVWLGVLISRAEAPRR